jgi:proteasome lid subunit RPN8/RPN11
MNSERRYGRLLSIGLVPILGLTLWSGSRLAWGEEREATQKAPAVASTPSEPQEAALRDAKEAEMRARHPEPWHYTYATLDEAAVAVLRYIATRCGDDPHERGGYIVALRFPQKPTVYAPKRYLIGKAAECHLGPEPDNAAATYHTHPKLEYLDSENPSRHDRRESERLGIPYYIGTPTRIIVYMPASANPAGDKRQKGTVRVVAPLKPAPPRRAPKTT